MLKVDGPNIHCVRKFLAGSGMFFVMVSGPNLDFLDMVWPVFCAGHFRNCHTLLI
jgi:hypothetical protein